jgi:hypothetical protein
VINPQYRRDYSGEYVVINTDIRRGIKHQRREWIPNPIINQHISGRAAVIGSAVDRDDFDYTRLQRHRGGLQGSKKLQTYSTGSIWRDMRLDFYCGTDRQEITQLAATHYQDSTTCYTTARFCLMWPGSFFMVPFQPSICDLASAIYLAAFDGHEEIFLLGYNADTPAGTRRWQQDIHDVIAAYSTHRFVFVGVASNMPDLWRNLENVETWNYRKFVTQCDV